MIQFIKLLREKLINLKLSKHANDDFKKSFFRLKLLEFIPLSWLKILYKQKRTDLVINPTLNVRVIGLVTSANGFIGQRGIKIPREEGEILPLEKYLYELLLLTAKFKGDSIKEKAFFSAMPEKMIELGYNLDIFVKKDSALKRLQYHSNVKNLPKELEVTHLNYQKYKDQDIDYIVNPHIYLQVKAHLPDNIFRVIQSESYNVSSVIFLDKLPILWLRDPGIKFVFPYHLSGSQGRVINRLLNGSVLVDDLSSDEFNTFLQVGIITTKELLSERNLYLEAMLSQAKLSLMEHNYCILNEIFLPFQCSCQRQYYRKLVKGGYMMPTSMQVHNREGMTDEAYTQFIHFQLTILLNRILPKKVKPSYSYLAHYYGGAKLEKHKDRKECEWNFSLVLDVSPNEGRENAWPIYLEIDGNIHEILLGIGDGVLYQGSSYNHWRNTLDEYKTVTASFFHFVYE